MSERKTKYQIGSVCACEGKRREGKRVITRLSKTQPCEGVNCCDTSSASDEHTPVTLGQSNPTNPVPKEKGGWKTGFVVLRAPVHS